MKVSEVAAAVDCRFTGDGEVDIQSVASLEKAGPADITFVMDRKHQQLIPASRAGAFILAPDTPLEGRPAVRSDNPYLTFARVLALFYHQPLPNGPFVHPTAVVAEDATLGRDCYIGPYVVVGEGARLGDRVRIVAHATVYPGVVIGDDTLIHSHAVVRENCVLGRRVILQSGAMIGCDGFGFAKAADGSYAKILQAGRVVLEDDVEIQANTCVDRGTLDDTRIGRGTKLDNLVQIGHGSEVGENCVFAGQVGLAGSTRVGNGVTMAGQVGVAGHCVIGDNVVIMAQSGVPGDIEKDRVVMGTPPVDRKDYMRIILTWLKLPELAKRLQDLEKALAELRKRE
jgi:UDP-3-O-[3-hydroxymyristoyl] glucosamine N-acyltransferase